MRIPVEIRSGLRTRLWNVADELDWARLSWFEKSAHYEAWSLDAEIGGLLSRYLDQRRIRVYIKDTIMKGYVRSRQADPGVAFMALDIPDTVDVAESYERPHGRHLADGRVIAWGNADDWKLVLMAVHERSYISKPGRPYAAVLLAAVGKYHQLDVRQMVGSAAQKLGIERLLWIPD